jgi:hypothetical protein
VITLFTIPKGFDGHIGLIQRNAIGSWAQLQDVDILLIGDDAGVAEAAEDLGCRHEPEVEKTELGTPLVSAAFATAREKSGQPLLGYVNTDIILLSDFVSAMRRVHKRDFLLGGQRWNTEIADPIDFDDSGWELTVREVVSASGGLATPRWIDYFVIPRGSSLVDLPPFAVGRPGWDNWLIRRARVTRTPVIDATQAITAVHQRHDYSHIPGGTGQGSPWAGPEAEVNEELQDGSSFGIWHATHVLGPRGPVPAFGREYVRRRWWTRHEVDGGIEWFLRFLEPVLVPALRFARRVQARLRGSSGSENAHPE